MHWYVEDERLLFCNRTRHHFSVCCAKVCFCDSRQLIFLMQCFDVCSTPVDVSNVLKLYDCILRTIPNFYIQKFDPV